MSNFTEKSFEDLHAIFEPQLNFPGDTKKMDIIEISIHLDVDYKGFRLRSIDYPSFINDNEINEYKFLRYHKNKWCPIFVDNEVLNEYPEIFEDLDKLYEEIFN